MLDHLDLTKLVFGRLSLVSCLAVIAAACGGEASDPASAASDTVTATAMSAATTAAAPVISGPLATTPSRPRVR